MRTQPSNGRWRMASLLVASAVLSACSQTLKPPSTAKVTSPSTSATSTTAAPTTTSTTTAPQPKLVYAHHFTPAQQAVAQGYFAAVKAFLHAASGPATQDSALAGTHIGAMLRAVRAKVGDLVKRGQAVRLPSPTQFAIRVEEVQVHGPEASLSVCAIDDGVVFERTTGHVVNAALVSSSQQVTMRHDAGVWKLAERTVPKRQQGNAACHG